MRLIPRPLQSELEEIQEILMQRTLPEEQHGKLLMVRDWAKPDAKGFFKTAREVAKIHGVSDFTVLSAVRTYRRGGLAAFRNPPTVNRGKPAVPQDKVEAVIAGLLRGTAYRTMRDSLGVSLGSIAAIARREKLLPAKRRVRLSPKEYVE